MSRSRNTTTSRYALLIILVVLGGFLRADRIADMKRAAKDSDTGALELLTGADGKSKAILYRDRVYARGAASGPEPIVINIKDVSMVERSPDRVSIQAIDGRRIYFNVAPASAEAAGRFTEKLEELVKS